MEPIKLAGLQPKAPLGYFEKFCSIPHGSGNTKEISDYIVSFAKEHGLRYIQDEYNDVIIFGDGTCGYEDHEPVILQGHIDMVCEKDADCPINMLTDPLDIYHDGKFIYARGTTLGADNGVAAAYGLALLADPTIPHPPIELICTADEETTMEGANKIDLSSLKGRRLINLDTGTEGRMNVSCAGGARADITLPAIRQAISGTCVKLIVADLQGGHSGGAVKNRANANKVMGEFLRRIQELTPLNIMTFNGGNKSNAVPRACEATVVAETADIEQINAIANKLQDDIRAQYDEPYGIIRAEIMDANGGNALTAECSANAISFLCAAPYGVLKWDENMPGYIQTSMNMGIVNLDKAFHFVLSARSSVNQEKAELMEKVKGMTEAHHGTFDLSWQCSAWEFKKDSALQATMKRIYKEMRGEELQLNATHGILECGALCAKIPGVDCVSVGPTMRDLHTSRERLDIASFKRTWDYLLEVMKAL